MLWKCVVICVRWWFVHFVRLSFFSLAIQHICVCVCNIQYRLLYFELRGIALQLLYGSYRQQYIHTCVYAFFLSFFYFSSSYLSSFSVWACARGINLIWKIAAMNKALTTLSPGENKTGKKDDGQKKAAKGGEQHIYAQCIRTKYFFIGERSLPI